MRYIYHYHAIYSTGFSTVHLDGVITAAYSPIDSMDRYREIKQVIDAPNADKLTITSLSLLHTVEK